MEWGLVLHRQCWRKHSSPHLPAPERELELRSLADWQLQPLLLSSLAFCWCICLDFHVPLPFPPCLSCSVAGVPSWSHAHPRDGFEHGEVSVLGGVPLHGHAAGVLHAPALGRAPLCAGGLQRERPPFGLCRGAGSGEPALVRAAPSPHRSGRGIRRGHRRPADGHGRHGCTAEPTGLRGSISSWWGQVGEEDGTGAGLHGHHHAGER